MSDNDLSEPLTGGSGDRGTTGTAASSHQSMALTKSKEQLEEIRRSNHATTAQQKG